MTAQQELEARITAAHSQYARTQSAADRAALEGLQDRYRRSGYLTSASRGGAHAGTISIVEHRPTVTDQRPSHARGGAPAWPSRIAMPAGLLREFRNIGWSGHEEGGYLVGHSTPPDDHERVVLSQHKASLEWESHRTRTTLDLDRGLALLQQLPTDLTICGDVHLHPANESVSPSQQDVCSWGGMAQYFRRSEWVGVIVAERQDANGNYLGADIGGHLVRWQGGVLQYRQLDVQEERI